MSQESEYDPEWIEFEQNVGLPDLPGDLDGRRESFNKALVEFAKKLPPTDPGIQTRDEQISLEVKVRIYTPPTRGGPGRTLLPLVVFAHGGGWLSGNLDTEDHVCRIVCGEVPCIVVSVDYRIFPFVQFPTPIEDCYDAYQWAYDNAEKLGADKARYAIWGGSAGATLSTAVAYRLVSTGQGERINGLINMAAMLIHPEAVPEPYEQLHKSYTENAGQIPVITGPEMLLAYGLIPGQENWDKIDWFPVSGGAGALKGFPRTYLINTSKEALRDDAKVMEMALKDAGVPVRRDVLLGLPHYFWCFGLENAGKRFRTALVEGIKWVVS